MLVECFGRSKNQLIHMLFNDKLDEPQIPVVAKQSSRSKSFFGKSRKSRRASKSHQPGPHQRRGSKQLAKQVPRRPTAKSVGSTFVASLKLLLAKMESRQPHFVRCIKPNAASLSGSFDDEFVTRQLKYTGMLETVRIRQSGFPHRPTFYDFAAEFGLLDSSLSDPERSSAPRCEKALLDLGFKSGSDFVMGKTKVFLSLKTVERLAVALDQVHDQARLLQSVAKGLMARMAYKKALVTARLEDAAALAFFEDVGYSQRQLTNTLQVLVDEDDRREKINSVKKLPERGTKAFEKMVAKDRAQVVKWFRATELPRHAVSSKRVTGGKPLPAAPVGVPRTAWGGVSSPDIQVTDPDNDRGDNKQIAPWFHGMLGRAAAEQQLAGQPTGTFLVRVSESRRGYTVSLVHDTRFRHYKVSVLEDLRYSLDGVQQAFDSLHDLVDFFLTHPLSKHLDTLVKPLGVPDDYYEKVQYAELLWDRARSKKARLATPQHPAHESSKMPSGFANALASVLNDKDTNDLQTDTIIRMEQRFGVRQDGLITRNVSSVPPSPIEERRSALENVALTTTPIKSRPLTTSSYELGAQDVVADAKRRIALAHQEWDKKKPATATGQAPKRRRWWCFWRRGGSKKQASGRGNSSNRWDKYKESGRGNNTSHRRGTSKYVQRAMQDRRQQRAQVGESLLMPPGQHDFEEPTDPDLIRHDYRELAKVLGELEALKLPDLDPTMLRNQR
eukprot:m.411658 g.411658  ORF g.411658 m.411658 type:complete len:728 (-) comp20165_c0_seq8:127-2310(-)